MGRMELACQFRRLEGGRHAPKVHRHPGIPMFDSMPLVVRRALVLAALVSALATLPPPTPLAAQEEHAIQVALLAPIQAFPAEDAVRGLRLSLLYGRNSDVTGMDIGLVPHVTGDFLGVQWGGVNLVDGDTEGVQWGVVNVTDGHLTGLQASGVVNVAGTGEGAQLAWWVNHSRNFRGLQIALVNYAERLHGVQLGLVNIIREGGVLPVMPLVNWSFPGEPM